MLDLLASQPHYLDHMLPVWAAMPAQGTLLVYGQAVAHAQRLGLPYALPRASRSQAPVLVAGALDSSLARRLGRPVAYMEHGCGQSYAGEPRTAKLPSYAGGRGRDHCALILAPNEMAAARWRAAYPGKPVHVVGATRPLGGPSGPPLLCVSFHWSAPSSPELRPAAGHYMRQLGQLAKVLPVIGHAHPRAVHHMAGAFARAGIEFVADLEEVARRATVYAVDNSSTLWELGRTRPVIAMNAPWFRRHVHHGLRFWSHVPGPQVDDAVQLQQVAAQLLAGESATQRAHREQVVADVIPHIDGAARAGTLLERWLRSGSA